MKASKAILKGYESNGGRQVVNEIEARDGAMCVWGAHDKGAFGDPWGAPGAAAQWQEFEEKFAAVWGIDPVSLNNNSKERGRANEPFPWEHIYGMAVAAGL